MTHMKSIATVLSIIALGFGLLGCPSDGGVSTPAFAVSTTAADFGVVGNAYTSTLAATGGTAPFTWTVFGGVLPTGLSLNAGTGIVSGTLGAPAGNFNATFTVTDSTGKTATGSVLFAIHPRTDRVSVDTNGNSVAGATNTEPTISRTGGRFIAFTSTGSTLIVGVVGQQIYVHDRQTGQPSLASKNSLGSAGIGGVSSAASVSADGRFIAFASTATNLVAGVSGQQIYLHDTQTSVAFPNGQTTLVSKDNSGVASDGSIKANPAISADGRFITYEANATTLVAGVSGQQIYLHDTQTSVAFPNGQTTLVSKNNSGTAGNGLSKTPTISNDGRFIAFASASSNLATGISGTQIYRHDTQTSVAFPNGQTLPVSIDDSGVAGVGLSTAPVIIDDGSVAAFVSTAPLVPGAAAASDIYVRALP
jgi:hypothetical protein